MNPELRAVLTEALAKHRRYAIKVIDRHQEEDGYDYRVDCRCGLSFTAKTGPAAVQAQEYHAVEALLSLPGVAVIQLPEATYAEYPDEWSSSTAPEDEWDTWVDGRGNIQVRTQGYATADGARNLAAALLAAAVVAEGEDNHG
ncbi:hypothetical protein PBI_CHE9D_91 [Mycobacterium phage Che9d]|uniref:Uncharacterized protein n=1 Tax=Mycobacterium phage Che9d TaxID=2907834 RepID=Q855M2_9CAUD|nr:hypothetical protein PBI_CHE9D_91 [Mycobacterium phage Che9d]AAN08009.1 hypothetical protein PBI_CHE9D_91 [Mycobacterium phage Che9d]